MPNSTQTLAAKSSAECLITWIVQAYGHCIPRGQTITGPALAEEIRKVYTTDTSDAAGPINDTAARIAQKCPGRFAHRHCTISYENP